ncbi:MULTISPECIES: hypothetical protein [Acidithiobacillus]|jgi:hypothetical protein|uniref:Uncharacterized protein n=1 Tax=Acidithiobacillus thiooxidans TaxID=930 RepID=A0A1C2IJD4_ACITH|nr:MULTISPECIES: hypothetical protein [Acidithiobacillus]MBU2828174.1 hypothetical protein [Acidithiobacillus ferriphilus]MBU2846115.1 hypothetical protein [Acidithiobacillus ferriphilus]MBU2856763.1 hypothetical protein [Acidithiobacillus ferrooxidans]OCX76094.1 hypothetical protein A6P07_03065 [Acidithiobacillus thiooxidans]OCX79114.1 hypothetical protein A6O24_02690 [Acidithiobacillus thiooxidans]
MSSMNADLESFVPTVRHLCGDDPEQVRKLMEMTLATMTSQPSTPTIEKLNKPDAVILDLGTTAKNWRHLAPHIKKFLACAGQSGAPGCRTEPDRKDREIYSGGRPEDGFTTEEIDLILKMAKRHGRSPTAIQRKWAWGDIADRR